MTLEHFEILLHDSTLVFALASSSFSVLCVLAVFDINCSKLQVHYRLYIAVFIMIDFHGNCFCLAGFSILHSPLAIYLAAQLYLLGPIPGSSLKSHGSVWAIDFCPKLLLLVSIFCHNLSTKFFLKISLIRNMSSLSKKLRKNLQHLSVNCHKNATS